MSWVRIPPNPMSIRVLIHLKSIIIWTIKRQTERLLNMAIRLSTTLAKIGSVPNADNSRIIRDFYEYMKANGTSENYQNQNLKAMIVFANALGSSSFFDIKSKQQIVAFLDTKMKDHTSDPDKRWITTWNDYLWRIKYFLRWLYNHKKREERGIGPMQ
jgi:integrase/recombinase XerD